MTTSPHPLTPTVGSTVGASLRSHGRRDYRLGAPFRPEAAQAWRDGWTDEAQLTANAVARPQVAAAITGLDALRALEAANRVLTQCTTHRPTIMQGRIMREAKPLIDEALARLTEAAGRDGDAETT